MELYDPTAVLSPTTRRVLITGSRGFPTLDLVDRFVLALPKHLILVHGAARGVDQRADGAARLAGLEIEPHPVSSTRWAVSGPKAGFLRNRRMLQTLRLQTRDPVVGFWDGVSRGTAGCLDEADALGLPVFVIYPGSKIVLIRWASTAD